ncbi:MAG: hypothetical protein AAFN70_00185, partial [Planctomycetota bacterium]
MIAALLGQPSIVAQTPLASAPVDAFNLRCEDRMLVSLQRLDQLISAGQVDAACEWAIRLIDEDDGRLVPVFDYHDHYDAKRGTSDTASEPKSPATSDRAALSSRRPFASVLRPLHDVVHDRLMQTDPPTVDIRRQFCKLTDPSAVRGIQSLRRDGESDPLARMRSIDKLLRRYRAGTHGDALLLMRSEILLQLDAPNRAAATLLRISPQGVRTLSQPISGDLVSGSSRESQPVARRVAWAADQLPTPEAGLPQTENQ